jgi:hypothetical protein
VGDWSPGTYPGLGLVVGAALGVVVGILLDNLAMGLLGGAGLGLVLGAVVMTLGGRR